MHKLERETFSGYIFTSVNFNGRGSKILHVTELESGNQNWLPSSPNHDLAAWFAVLLAKNSVYAIKLKPFVFPLTVLPREITVRKAKLGWTEFTMCLVFLPPRFKSGSPLGKLGECACPEKH